MYQRIEFFCASLLLASIVVLVAIASITRHMGTPIIWSIEIAQLLFVWLCMLAADLAMQHNRHFGLSVILDNVPAGLRKIIQLVNAAVVIGFLIYLLYYAFINMQLMHPRLIGATQMHASYVHAAMPFGLILMLRTLGVQFFRQIRDWGNT